ncbi:MAG: hypothetical protein RSE00_00865 [Clostridia bacterium]
MAKKNKKSKLAWLIIIGALVVLVILVVIVSFVIKKNKFATKNIDSIGSNGEIQNNTLYKTDPNYNSNFNAAKSFEEDKKNGIGFDYQGKNHGQLIQELQGIKSIEYGDSGRVVTYNAGYIAVYRRNGDNIEVKDDEIPYSFKKNKLLQ